MPYKDPEKAKAYHKAYKTKWVQDNPEKALEAGRKYDKRNAKKRKEAHRVWVDKNPEYVMLHHARSRAKKKGLDFSLERSDIQIPDVCPVLGIPIFKTGKGFAPNSPTLDRIDSTKGYVPGNVWVISWRANKLKADATLAELKQVVSAWETKLDSHSTSTEPDEHGSEKRTADDSKRVSA